MSDVALGAGNGASVSSRSGDLGPEGPTISTIGERSRSPNSTALLNFRQGVALASRAAPRRLASLRMISAMHRPTVHTYGDPARARLAPTKPTLDITVTLPCGRKLEPKAPQGFVPPELVARAGRGVFGQPPCKFGHAVRDLIWRETEDSGE